MDTILSAHFCSLFLIDILQFSFSYFVVAKSFNPDEPPKRSIYDHRKPVDVAADGRDTALVTLHYFVADFDLLLQTVMDKLSLIWTDPFDIVALWSIKNADDPSKAK